MMGLMTVVALAMVAACVWQVVGALTNIVIALTDNVNFKGIAASSKKEAPARQNWNRAYAK